MSIEKDSFTITLRIVHVNSPRISEVVDLVDSLHNYIIYWPAFSSAFVSEQFSLDMKTTSKTCWRALHNPQDHCLDPFGGVILRRRLIPLGGLLHSRSSVGSSKLSAPSGGCSQQSWLFVRWTVAGYWEVHHRWDRVVKQQIWKPCSAAALSIRSRDYPDVQHGKIEQLSSASYGFHGVSTGWKERCVVVFSEEIATPQNWRRSLDNDTFRGGPVPRRVGKAQGNACEMLI